jgi:hypothetical protein
MNDLLVFTPKFDFGPDKMHFLRDSCAHFGVELQTYGEGPWPGYVAGKITHAIPFLESRKEKYVLFCDASDTMMVRNPTDLVGRFLSFGRPVVISAERDCFPLRELASKFPPAESGYSFPNAGGFMGERDAVIAALEYMNTAYEDGEDQARWIRLIAENPSSVAIDSWCSIFQTMSGGAGSNVRFDGGACRNQRTGTHPYLLHFNGRTAGIEEVYQRCLG